MDQKQQKIQQCYITTIEKAAALPMALSIDTAYNLGTRFGTRAFCLSWNEECVWFRIKVIACYLTLLLRDDEIAIHWITYITTCAPISIYLVER